MKPTDRYLVTRIRGSRTWRVLDRHASAQGADADARVVLEGIPTGKLAMEIKAALVGAFNDGASAVKTGEVII